MPASARRSYASSRSGGARSAIGPGALARPIRIVLFVLAAIMLAPIALTPLYALIPPDSTLMLARAVTFRPVNRVWTPIDKMATSLPRAVLVSEDARFCSHHGVDWTALGDVMREGGDKGPGRGASTITMQVAKNLFLWQGGAYLRKPIEIALALWIDLAWSKKRIMEVYLNIAEWGPDGTFGAQAGAKRAFGRDAARLTPSQAALMAAALPNPTLRDPKRPNARQRAHAAIVASRARAIGALADCLK